MKVLAICGSLRKGSSNHNLLTATEKLFPKLKEWVHFDISQLPFFDPSLQFSDVPTTVSELRKHAAEADFIVISTPEYAHGIPGLLKNSLEWLICEETMKKTVIVLIAAPSGGDYVKEYLLETLRTMDLEATTEKTLIVKNARNTISEFGKIHDANLRSTLETFLKSIVG